MIQLRTVLTVADNAKGARKLRVYMVHGGFKRKFGYIGDFVGASVVEAIPGIGISAGTKVKAVIVRTLSIHCAVKTDPESVLTIMLIILESVESKNPEPGWVFGPIAREVKERGYTKIASLAEEVV